MIDPVSESRDQIQINWTTVGQTFSSKSGAFQLWHLHVAKAKKNHVGTVVVQKNGNVAVCGTSIAKESDYFI